MKRYFVFMLMFCMTTSLLAQKTDEKNALPAPVKFYLGPASGFNNQSGLLGVNLELPVATAVSIGGGFGFSFWGSKAFLESRYYFHPGYKSWAIGAGITHSTGFDHRTLSLPTTSGMNENVTVHARPMTNAFIAGYKFWRLGKKRNRFYIEFGNSIELTTPRYSVTSGQTLTSEGNKLVKQLCPRGLIAAVGYSFAL